MRRDHEFHLFHTISGGLARAQHDLESSAHHAKFLHRCGHCLAQCLGRLGARLGQLLRSPHIDSFEFFFLCAQRIEIAGIGQLLQLRRERFKFLRQIVGRYAEFTCGRMNRLQPRFHFAQTSRIKLHLAQIIVERRHCLLQLNARRLQRLHHWLQCVVDVG